MLVLTALALASLLYCFVFMTLPVGEGVVVDEDGRNITRGGLVLSTLLYPEGLATTWFDGGRLPSNFFDRIPLAVATLAWLGLATLVGLPSVPLIYDRQPTSAARLERLSLAALVGLALLSTVTLFVGLIGGLRTPWPLASACAASAALACAAIYFWRRSTTATATVADEQTLVDALHTGGLGLFDRCLFSVAVGLTIWLAVVTMLGAWMPSAEFDVMEYHLQAPKEFVQRGAIEFLPHNIYANMPLGAEMHTLAMMVLFGGHDVWLAGLIGKSITASMALIAAVLLGASVGRRLGRMAGWTAAGLWLATPGIAHSSMLGLIDAALAAYVLATAVAVTHVLHVADQLREVELSGSKSSIINGATLLRWQALRGALLNWWWIAALLAGAAAAVKYPGLLFAVIPLGCAFAWAAWQWHCAARPKNDMQLNRAAQRTLLQAAAIVCVALLATCGSWYAKNWVLAGNPVYPLAAGLFGGKTLTPQKIEQWQAAHRVPQSAPAGATTVQRFVAAVHAATRDLLRLTLTSSFVQPAMICGLMLALVVVLDYRQKTSSTWRMWLLWSLWIVGVWWFATHRIDRFWLPITGLWAGVGAVGLARLRSDVSRWLTHALLLIGLLYGSLLNSSPLVSDNRYFVALAALRDDLGDQQQVPRVSREQAWINANLDPDTSRVLLIGEARVFEYRVPILYSTCFDTNPGEALLRDRSAPEQSRALHKHGITHVMVNWSEINRYRSPGNYGFSDWPQASDIERMLAEKVLSQVDWGIPASSAVLLRVH